MIGLLKWAPWVAVGLAIIAAGVFWALMRSAQGQRDAAKAKQAAAELTSEVHRQSAKAAADAADRLATEVRDAATRCDAAVADLRARADGYRSALRRCPSGEALAKRMGALFP